MGSFQEKQLLSWVEQQMSTTRSPNLMDNAPSRDGANDVIQDCIFTLATALEIQNVLLNCGCFTLKVFDFFGAIFENMVFKVLPF